MNLILAPLRGVTIRAFRKAFASAIAEAGFTGAVAPFVAANPGLRVRNDYLRDVLPFEPGLVPQAIGKDPDALRILLKAFKDRGYGRVNLNAGCPFPMIVRRGRGSGLIRNPDTFRRMLDAGCSEMGPGCFSVKMRLGLERPDEIFALLDILNAYPLEYLAVHARTAAQMYEGECLKSAFPSIIAASRNPVVANGDFAATDAPPDGSAGLMVGRAFVRGLAQRPDSAELLAAYADISRAELHGPAAVLGRLKELLSYWKDSSRRWGRIWAVAKLARSVEELLRLA